MRMRKISSEDTRAIAHTYLFNRYSGTTLTQKELATAYRVSMSAISMAVKDGAYQIAHKAMMDALSGDTIYDPKTDNFLAFVINYIHDRNKEASNA